MKNFSKVMTDKLTNQGKRDWINKHHYRVKHRESMKLLIHLIRRGTLDLSRAEHLRMYEAGVRNGYILEDLTILKEVK